MSQSKSNKAYVVFEGRSPGVYLSWTECQSQVNGYKGNVHKSFDSYEEAFAAWVNYCNSKSQRSAHLDTPHRHEWEGASGSRLPSQHNTLLIDARIGQFAPSTDSEEFILQHSMQMQLQQVCSLLRILPPAYTLHEVKDVDGVQFRRYYASVCSGAIGTPAVSFGRFGKSDYDALEDVAASLLRRLVSATGKKIRDYNYYSVEMLENNMRNLTDDKLRLEMEIAMLHGEDKMLT